VCNLSRADGQGILEAGSDVFPNDPRPVAFATDCRLGDIEIAATLTHVGLAPGVVVRRTASRVYYAAIYDTARLSLAIVRRVGVALDELAATPVVTARAPVTLKLAARNFDPTRLEAELVDADGLTYTVAGDDATSELQGPGDAGVLATADTLFPSDRNPVLPALGNLHLLPWGVQQGQAFMRTTLGRQIIAEIRRRSSARFSAIEIRSAERPGRSHPAVVAATTGPPIAGGARLLVATDIAADVELELSYSPDMLDSWTVDAGPTGRFHSTSTAVRGLEPGRRVHWRALARRGGPTTTGPVRSFPVLPEAGSEQPVRIAVAACASQFGPIFGFLAERRPDVFVWQGDLNYPDTVGPFAQTMSGYAGIWRDFLANPILLRTTAHAAFAPQRDDHDYALQDANSTEIPRYPWGIEPWDALMNRRLYYRFRAGAAEVWVLDQRRHKSDPKLPDTVEKTLLGTAQRRWLLRTLAASDAEFKVICSPCTVFMDGNGSDGNWGSHFTAERDLLMRHVHERVSGRAIFLTGDYHLTAVYDAPGRFESRAAPLGIPVPNDVTLVNPFGAERLESRPEIDYADNRCHFNFLEVAGSGADAVLDLRLVREDGVVPYRRRFQAAA
jgi:hypothetical protein